MYGYSPRDRSSSTWFARCWVGRSRSHSRDTNPIRMGMDNKSIPAHQIRRRGPVQIRRHGTRRPRGNRHPRRAGRRRRCPTGGVPRRTAKQLRLFQEPFPSSAGLVCCLVAWANPLNSRSTMAADAASPLARFSCCCLPVVPNYFRSILVNSLRQRRKTVCCQHWKRLSRRAASIRHFR
jgi:hypothetical protein